MLYQLMHYAQSRGLSGRPGYIRKRIRAIVSVGEDGRIRAETSDRFVYAPSLSQPELVGKGGIRSHFLADAMSTAAGLNEKKHSAFAALHEEAARHLSALAPLARALSDPEALETMRKLLFDLKVKETEIITFRLMGSDLPIVEQDFWQGWWDRHRETLQKGTDGTQMRCLATGEMIEPALTQPKLKLMSIGGQGAGSTLISFDKEAFTSFGLDQAQNAACSEEAAAVYADALTDLIEKAPRPLAGTLLLHWFRSSIPLKDDPFTWESGTGESDEDEQAESAMEAAKRLAEAVHEGRRPELQHNRYYVILLAAEAGRAKVRSMFEGELKELYDHFKQWFDDLSITLPYGNGLANPPKLYAILLRLIRYRPDAKPRETSDAMDSLAPLFVRIWDSILSASPFPQAAASMALNNLRSRLLRSREEGEGMIGNLDRIAISILKLWYNRAVRFGLLSKGGAIVKEKLNIDYPDPAYHCGRLLAVLTHLQHRALGEIQADIVQRFYSSASVTPGLVIGRLVAGAKPHLNKLSRTKQDAMVVWYEKQIAEIMQKIGVPPPNQLDFSGQTIFALGYYHQVSALFEKNAKEEKEVTYNGTEESL